MVAGLLGVAVDFFTGRDKDAADAERPRRVLKEPTPDFADAVIKGFAVHPDDLKHIANPDSSMTSRPTFCRSASAMSSSPVRSTATCAINPSVPPNVGTMSRSAFASLLR